MSTQADRMAHRLRFGLGGNLQTLQLVIGSGFIVALGTNAYWPRVSGAAFWLLVIAGLAILCVRRPITPHGAADTPIGATDTRWRNWVWLAALAPVACNALSIAYFGLGARDFSWTPLLMLPVLAMLVQRCGLPPWVLGVGAALGCVVSLVFAAFDAWRFDDMRVSLGTNALLFGQIVLSHVVACLWLSSGDSGRGRTPWLLLAALCGFTATMIVGYRGALAILPLMVAALFRFGDPDRRSRAVPWKAALLVSLLSLAAFAAVFAISGHRPEIVSRLEMLDDEVSILNAGQVAHSSVGSRAVLWRAAWEIFTDHPLMGVGAHRFFDAISAKRAAGQFPLDVDLFHHAHSIYLNVAAEYGIVGLLCFGAGLVFLWKALGRCRPEAKLLAGYLLACWMLMGLTNDLMAHQNMLRAMVLLLALCLGQVSMGQPPLTSPSPVPRAADRPPRGGGDLR